MPAWIATGSKGVCSRQLCGTEPVLLVVPVRLAAPNHRPPAGGRGGEALGDARSADQGSRPPAERWDGIESFHPSMRIGGRCPTISNCRDMRLLSRWPRPSAEAPCINSTMHGLALDISLSHFGGPPFLSLNATAFYLILSIPHSGLFLHQRHRIRLYPHRRPQWDRGRRGGRSGEQYTVVGLRIGGHLGLHAVGNQGRGGDIMRGVGDEQLS